MGGGDIEHSPPGYFSLKIPPYSFKHLSTYLNPIERKFRFMSRRLPMTGRGFGPGMAENGLISEDFRSLEACTETQQAGGERGRDKCL